MLIGVIAEELLLPSAAGQSALFVDTDLFPSATLAVPGFLLLEGQFDQDDAIHPTFVSDGHPGIYPPLLVDLDVIHAFTRAFVAALSPSLVRDDLTDLFFGPIVNNKVLGPQRVIDADLFGGTKIEQTATISQQFSIDTVIDVDAIFNPIIGLAGITLITRQAALATEADVIYVSETTTSDTLLASFLHQAASFSAPPLGNLTPHAVAVDDGFFAPNVRRTMAPSFFHDTDVFFVPTRGNYALSGAVFDSDIAFAPSIGRQLLLSAVADTDNIIGPAFTQPGTFDLYVDAGEFIVAATVTQQSVLIIPTLLSDTDAFFSPSGGQGLIAPFIGAETYYVPTVSLGPLTVLVSVIDPETIFVPVIGDAPHTPSLFVDTDTFFVPSMGITRVLTAGIVTDTDTFYAPTTITQSGFDGVIAIGGPIMPSTPQPTVIYIED